MYAGYVDGAMLFAAGMPGYEIVDGTLHQADGECDSAEFRLPAINTMRDVPVKRASVISIRKDGVEVFRGSVADTSADLRGTRTYNVDGAMLWLADIRKPPFVMTEDTVTYYVTALLTQYNAACLAAKQIKLGTIDATLPKLAVEQTEYKTILDLLQEAMQQVGGMLRIRYADGDIYLDCIKSYTNVCLQTVDINANLLSLEDKIDGADLITRVYPIGKDGLTIASVNGGAVYLVNASAEALYGRIDGTLRVDTDDAEALKAAAASYLAQNCGLSRGIQVTAADLSAQDITIESFAVGDSVRVISPPHGIDCTMRVSKLDTSLVGNRASMTIGWGRKTLTGSVASGGRPTSASTGGAGVGTIVGTIDVDSKLSATSTNPVQNKVITSALAGKASTAVATQSAAGLMSAADKAKLDSLPSKDNIVHADIPDYIKTAALEVAKKVQAVRTSESIVFIAASDAHQLDTSADIVAGNKHAGMAMKALAYILPGIDFACYLGDYTAGSATTTLAEGRQHFAEINADIDEAFSGIPQFRTLGNHDSLQYSKAQNGSVLSAAELYGLCGAYNTGAVMGSTTEGYCYRDFESKKLRVICLNTAENSEKEYVSDAQKLWFANALKAVGAKAGWNVLILSHHPLDWGGVYVLSNIVKAYVDGGSITVSSGNTVNFSGSNSATILAAIHGHVHCFKAAKLNAIASGAGTEYNIWRVATPNMCFARNNEYGQNGNAEYYGIEFGETTTYNKTANSAKDTAFVVNVINPSQQKLYSYCYGAGYDREIFTGIQTVAVTGVTLNAASGELTIGGQTTLTATVKPADASNKTVTWASSAPTVASVVNGVVTALAPGSAKITVKTADGGFTAEYALTVKAATSDLLADYGYADNTRLSTGSGSEKAAAGYVTIGHTAAIPIDKTRYPNGATIRVTGAVNCLGNNWSGDNNGGDSAFVLYTTGGTQFSNASYIEAKTTTAGTFTIDADKTGFTLNIASLSAPRYIKFCVKGVGANLTATLIPK